MRTKETVETETAQNFDTDIKTPLLTEIRRNKIRFYVLESQSTEEYRTMLGPVRSPRWIKNLVKFLHHPKIDENAISVWLSSNPKLLPNITRIRKMPKRFESEKFRAAFETHIKYLADEVEITVPEEEVEKQKTTAEMSPTNEDKCDSPEYNRPLPKLQLVSPLEPEEYFVSSESDSSVDSPITEENLTLLTTNDVEMDPHHSGARERHPNNFPFLLHLNKNSEIVPPSTPVTPTSQQNWYEDIDEDIFSDDSEVTTAIPGRRVEVELMDLQIIEDADQQCDWYEFLGSPADPSPVLTPQSYNSIPIIDLAMSEEQNIFEPNISVELINGSSEMDTTNDVSFHNPTANNRSSDSEEEIDVENMEELPSPPYEPIFHHGNSSVLQHCHASAINVAHGLLNMAHALSEHQRHSEFWQARLRNTDTEIVHAITSIENFFSHMKTSLDIIMTSINRPDLFPRKN